MISRIRDEEGSSEKRKMKHGALRMGIKGEEQRR